MACIRKENTGKCYHFQCEYSAESGVECVDIVQGFCEIGDGCVPECFFSWRKTDKETQVRADKAFLADLKSLLEKGTQDEKIDNS